MTTKQSPVQNFETLTTCPLCHEDLIIKWKSDNIPFFGEVMYITALCECSFRFADTMILTQKEPVRYEMTIDTVKDLDARVVRSTSGTIRIPELGIDVEPGTVSESYVTNIEGVLDRIQNVVVTASKWVKDDKEKYALSLEILKKLDDVKIGQQKLTVIIEDPLGNSAIISGKAVSKTLTQDESRDLKTGMIVFDIDSSEISVDTPDNVQPIGD
ncbi:MAG TPA: ZPR1 zinc finger domain-containing protein [Methanosarcinaceae archaeon]|nr:ZPR1 zinc finger domain-containing protein [Methanosarcinaceae archaeon]